MLAVAGCLAFAPVSGCTPAKDEGKGVVDESAPPAGNPNDSGAGKADDAWRTIAIDFQSPHPYQNDMDEVYAIDLAGTLPECAYRVRLHFSVLRTEANYDYLYVEGAVGEELFRFDGENDDLWTDWILVDAEHPFVNVRLESDYSITRHGFEIDAFEWDGGPSCPRVPFTPCADGTTDINSPPGVCECPKEPVCVDVSAFELRYQLFRGFDNTGKHTVGTTAYTTAPGPDDGLVDTLVGYVNEDDILRVAQAAAERGLFDAEGYSEYGEWNEFFSVKAGDREVAFIAPQGEHTSEVAAVIAAFQAVYECGWGDDRISCAEDYTCANHQCQKAGSCVCTAQYDPVCGVNGRTYSNACFAGCESVPTAHLGECGIEGDLCGTIIGLVCQPGFKCKWGDSGFGVPYPDEAGSCVPQSACDAPEHCIDLIHPAIPGAWACVDHTCQWQAGLVWQIVPNSQLETGHPYANNASDWLAVTLPAGAEAMRLALSGTFSLEQGYDYLDVWSWLGGRWQRVARYTGTAGPALEDEFEGRYHYLHFVSDYSVTEDGFSLEAQYR